MLVKRSSKNRITLPKVIAQHLPDIEYFNVIFRRGYIILRPVGSKIRVKGLKAVRTKIKALRLTRRDVEDAIRWARSR